MKEIDFARIERAGQIGKTEFDGDDWAVLFPGAITNEASVSQTPPLVNPDFASQISQRLVHETWNTQEQAYRSLCENQTAGYIEQILQRAHDLQINKNACNRLNIDAWETLREQYHLLGLYATVISEIPIKEINPRLTNLTYLWTDHSWIHTLQSQEGPIKRNFHLYCAQNHVGYPSCNIHPDGSVSLQQRDVTANNLVTFYETYGWNQNTILEPFPVQANMRVSISYNATHNPVISHHKTTTEDPRSLTYSAELVLRKGNDTRLEDKLVSEQREFEINSWIRLIHLIDTHEKNVVS